MRKYLILIVITITYQIKLHGQVDCLAYTREDIKFDYQHYSDSNDLYTITEHVDKILVKYIMEDSLEIIHYMRCDNKKLCDDDELICDSTVIKYLCEACFEFHISENINSPQRKWLKISTSEYISSKYAMMSSSNSVRLYLVPFMLIQKDSKYLLITFYTKVLTKKLWNKIKSNRIN